MVLVHSYSPGGSTRWSKHCISVLSNYSNKIYSKNDTERNKCDMLICKYVIVFIRNNKTPYPSSIKRA